MTPHEFLSAVMTYCALVGGSVSNYGRTQRRNVLVGGVPYSAHRFWLAADVKLDSALTAAQLFNVNERIGKPLPAPVAVPLVERVKLAARLDLFLVAEDDHDHLQPASWLAG